MNRLRPLSSCDWTVQPTAIMDLEAVIGWKGSENSFAHPWHLCSKILKIVLGASWWVRRMEEQDRHGLHFVAPSDVNCRPAFGFWRGGVEVHKVRTASLNMYPQI